jgi:DNA-binding transcriptional regulator YiaG
MIPEQCRAARGWLSLSQDELATLAGVSLSTIRDFETGRRKPITNNLDAMKRALETRGIRFLASGIEFTGIDWTDSTKSA